jgi:hypothetical protein
MKRVHCVYQCVFFTPQMVALPQPNPKARRSVTLTHLNLQAERAQARNFKFTPGANGKGSINFHETRLSIY